MGILLAHLWAFGSGEVIKTRTLMFDVSDLFLFMKMANEMHLNKTNNVALVPIKDSNQPDQSSCSA